MLPFYGKYDMAIALEVAEHLPENRGKTFISDLKKIAIKFNLKIIEFLCQYIGIKKEFLLFKSEVSL